MIRSWYRTAVVPRWVIARLLPTAGAGLVAGLVVLDVVLGLLPVAFVLATSVVVGQVPAAVDGGTGSAAWSDLVRTFVLAAVLFLTRQVLAPVQTALGVRMQRRIDGALRDRALRVALRSTSIAPMEDQATLEALTEATREFEADFRSPASAAGLVNLLARYVPWGSRCSIGVVVSWAAAAAILAGEAARPASTTPTAGEITVDGADLAPTSTPGSGSGGVAVMFQDFTRYALPAATTSRSARPSMLRPERTRRRGRARRNRATLIDALPQGLETVLSGQYQGGATSPAGSGSASRSPALSPSRRAPGCSCSTSRPPPRRARGGRALRAVPGPHRGPHHGAHLAPLLHRAPRGPIVVVEDGRVVEAGHDELLARTDSRYRAAVRAQARRFRQGLDATSDADADVTSARDGTSNGMSDNDEPRVSLGRLNFVYGLALVMVEPRARSARRGGACGASSTPRSRETATAALRWPLR